MVLWKKESTSKNACYIDLLSSNQIDRNLYDELKAIHGMVQKNETMTLYWREQGNKLFKAKKWAEAMVKYNDSICFAPNDSKSLGLGYANRSACFLHLKMYDKCLADIELAKNANYPQHLMHKLDEREAACLRAMENLTDMDEKVTPPQLSYSPNADFPCMADILEVRTNDEYGKHVVATCDIEVGKIVLLENALAFVGGRDCEHICKTCGKARMNFIPCPNCFHVMFCNAECMESNNMHKATCGALYNFRKNMIVETILFAVSAFPNAGSLMKFVECALASRDLNAPECESDAQTKYRLFLKLFALPKEINAVGQSIFNAYKMALGIPHIEQFFRSKQEKRFLVHLIGQHFCILCTNCIGILDMSNNADYMTVLGIYSSLFNHSCAPNILYLISDIKMIGYVLRPVKAGEQLFINYFEGKESQKSIEQDRLKFKCKCSKCVPCWKEEDRLLMRMDSDYYYFAHSNLEICDFEDHKKRLEFKLKLEKWFTKFGRLPWSPEFHLMQIRYSICCKKELAAWDY